MEAAAEVQGSGITQAKAVLKHTHSKRWRATESRVSRPTATDQIVSS